MQWTTIRYIISGQIEELSKNAGTATGVEAKPEQNGSWMEKTGSVRNIFV